MQDKEKDTFCLIDLESIAVINLKKVVIIIPTYNEALVIEKTVHEVFNALLPTDVSAHILIFDSCSTDNTQEIIRMLQETYPNLHLQTEAKKSGLGSAYLQAINYALDELQADIVFEFDADLSHQPHYLPQMIERMNTCDVVVGSRYVKGGSIPKNWGWHRKLLSVLGNVVARVMLTPKYKDFTSGFRATNSLLLKKVLPTRFISNQYAYKLELLWLLHKARAKIIEHPIEFVDREQGQSKLPANSVLDSLRVLARLRCNALKPYVHMCVVGVVGLVLQCLIYNLLRIKCTPFFAAQIAVIAAIINNFILHNQFTFKQKSMDNHVKSMTYFIMYSLLMIGFQSSWTQLGVHYWGAGMMKENIIVASGIFWGSLLNYLVYSRFIWRNTKEISIQPH